MTAVRDLPVIHFLTPTYRPAGGVVKVFDYLVHGLDLGYRAEVYCPAAISPTEPLLDIPRFDALLDDERVAFHEGLSLGVAPSDLVLFSWPPHFEAIARGMTRDVDLNRVIHLVQNTRHANVSFADGYATRLLSRPMTRISVSHETTEACLPHLNAESRTETIVEGHDWGFFWRERRGGLPQRIRVAYTTWKSEVGHRVRDLAGGRFAFRAITKVATWREVKDLLHWCDVFLCCPGPEEGFYLPGLEALAAGAIVITPDVGGNRAYCRFGENCLLVGFEQAVEYVEALNELAASPERRIDGMRTAGYGTLERHTLSSEREQFAELLVAMASDGARRALGSSAA